MPKTSISHMQKPQTSKKLFSILLGIFFILVVYFFLFSDDDTQYNIGGNFDIPWTAEFANKAVDIKSLDETAQDLWVKHLMFEGLSGYQARLYAYRSQEYFPFIEKILKDRNLPIDLKYLAVAESGLRGKVVSHAGAAGIWQLMSDTARSFGLQVNDKVDERLHFQKATVAAIDHYKRLYQKYDDHFLAMAAYNVGEGNLDTMLEYQNAQNFFDLYLNPETSAYIYRVMSLKYILENPGKFGIGEELPYDMPPQDEGVYKEFASVDNLRDLAGRLGVQYRTLRILNPWIGADELGKGPWNIKIPPQADV